MQLHLPLGFAEVEAILNAKIERDVAKAHQWLRETMEFHRRSLGQTVRWMR